MATISASSPEPATSATAAHPSIALGSGAAGWAEHRLTVLGGAGCLALLALTFWPTLNNFVRVWTTDENYSHGFLVPLISLYFAREAARRGPIPIQSGAGLGAALLLLALIGRCATVLVPIGIVGDLSFLLGLAGLCSLLLGSAALKRFSFALAFLVFMVPWPVHLYTTVASPLQRLVSLIAAALLNAGNIPVLREGNTMTLPGGVQMFVAEACSGMRQLTGFLALTTAVAYLTPRPVWARIVVVASAIPVALTANVARVVLTGWIMYHNPRLALGAFHTAEGLLMMGFGLALLGAGCWALNQLAPTSRTREC